MDFLSGFISTPRVEHLLINHYIIIGVSALFLFYIGILFGSISFALLFNTLAHFEENSFYRQFAKDLVSTFMAKKIVGFILGILPVAVLAIAYAQNLFEAEIKISQYFFYIFLFSIIGVVFAFLFKSAMLKEKGSYEIQQLLGSISLFSLLFMVFIFVSSTSLILFPSKWTLIKLPIPVFFDFNLVVRFIIFLIAAMGFTGSAILFFYFNWMGGKQNIDEKYQNFVLKFGGGVAIASTLLLPIFILWNYKTIPLLAESTLAYELAIGVVFILMIICILAYTVLSKYTVHNGTQIFVLFIIVSISLSFTDNLARETALTEHSLYLYKKAKEVENEFAMMRDELRGPVETDAAMGEQIFNTRCIACHKFDQRLVGPPYVETLPKYENDIESLANFILNPVKINPEYPVMPNQGLKPNEAKAVADYIMKIYLEEYKK
jgi:cytochrome c